MKRRGKRTIGIKDIQSKDKNLSDCQIDNDNNSFNNLNFKTINENESMANLKQKSLDGNVILNFISNRDDLLNEFQLQRENMRKKEEKFLKLEEVTVYPLVIRELRKQSRVKIFEQLERKTSTDVDYKNNC